MSTAQTLSTRRLGAGGPEVPEVGLGTNNFGARIDGAAATKVVGEALAQGITLFDTADIYGGGESERLLGEALRGRREQALIATKFGATGRGEDPSIHRGTPEFIRGAVERSLARLQVEVIDLYQMHRPDPATPIAETMGALQQLVDEGKVRYLGCSNFASWQVVDAQWTAKSSGQTQFVCAQDEYNLLDRQVEQELLPALDHLQMGLLPYFPLASGLLTGKYHRGQPAPTGSRLSRSGYDGILADDERLLRVERLEQFAQARGISLLQVAFGALLSRPVVTCVIAGATSPEQVRSNVAVASWTASEEDWKELDQITLPQKS